MLRHCARAAFVLSLFCLGVSGLVGQAHSQNATLLEMQHDTWRGGEGAPQGIQALAQTPDGIIWIGSTAGLFTFNGITFQRFEVPQGDPELPGPAISSLYVARNGDLWVTGLYVGAACIHEGHVRLYPSKSGRLISIQEDSAGVIHALSDDRQLVRLDPSGQQTEDTPGDYLYPLFIDSSDTYYIVRNGFLRRRARGEAEFLETSFTARGEDISFAEEPDHTIWMTDRLTNRDMRSRQQTVLRHFDRYGHLLESRSLIGEVKDLAPDVDGSLWFTTSFGLGRLSAERTDRNVTKRARVTLDFIPVAGRQSSPDKDYALLIDRNDNVWVGGLLGLDRFRRRAIYPALPDAAPGDWSVCTNPKGDIWIANDSGILALVRGATTKYFPGSNGIYKLLCPPVAEFSFLTFTGSEGSHKTPLCGYHLSQAGMNTLVMRT